jgi:hypothetical protein
MDVDEETKADTAMKSPTVPSAEPQNDHDSNVAAEQPPALKFTLQVAFAMLTHFFHRPTQKSSQYARSNLNPYLTFLSTILKHRPTQHRPTLDILERSIPWDKLACFFSTIPRTVSTKMTRTRSRL